MKRFWCNKGEENILNYKKEETEMVRTLAKLMCLLVDVLQQVVEGKRGRDRCISFHNEERLVNLCRNHNLIPKSTYFKRTSHTQNVETP